MLNPERFGYQKIKMANFGFSRVFFLMRVDSLIFWVVLILFVFRMKLASRDV